MQIDTLQPHHHQFYSSHSPTIYNSHHQYTANGTFHTSDPNPAVKHEDIGRQEMNNTQGYPYGQPYSGGYATTQPSNPTQGHYAQPQYAQQQQQPPQQYAQPHMAGQQQQQQQAQQQSNPYSQYRTQNQLPSLSQTGLAPNAQSLPGIPRLGNSYAPQASQMYAQSQMAPPAMQGRPNVQAMTPALQDMEGEDAHYKYRLEVVQQPRRARMCGFGDKDRRPITPPPCIKLFITDKVTGKNIPPSAFESHGCFFVLSVDLWDETGSREVNVVRTNGTSPAPSISNSTTTSYPPPPDRPLMGAYSYVQGPDGMLYAPMQGYAQEQFYNQSYGHVPSQSSSSTMMTRNLIGSLTVNATMLTAPKDTPAFWFVLQDLSVRTEGWFRLKMNFIDVGAGMTNQLNKGKAPVLATTFSDKFQVFSAKKFPGVIESTPLSKEFAQQGIKIPIRKDNSKGGNDGGSDDEDGE